MEMRGFSLILWVVPVVVILSQLLLLFRPELNEKENELIELYKEFLNEGYN